MDLKHRNISWIALFAVNFVANFAIGQDIIIDVNFPGIIVVDDDETTPISQMAQTSVDGVGTFGTEGSDITTEARGISVDTSPITQDDVDQTATLTLETEQDSTVAVTMATGAEVSIEQDSTVAFSMATGPEVSTIGEDRDTRSVPFVIIPTIPQDGAPCIRESHEGCNLTNLERCILIRERAYRCVCLSGYARSQDGSTCLAVEQYMGTLPTAEIFIPELLDKSSEEYRLLEFRSRDTLIKALQNSNLRAIAMDVVITGIRRGEDGTALVDFKVDISREYAPTQDMVREALKDGLQTTITNGESTVSLSPTDGNNLEITAPDPCSNPLLNYCDVRATCTRGRRGFFCQCPAGEADLSYNIGEAPGEKCSGSQCTCDNGGICQETDGEISCSCQGWYIGQTCSVDGKALLIALVCILGFVVVLTLLICIFCCYSNKYSSALTSTSCEAIVDEHLSVRKYQQPRYFYGNQHHIVPNEPRLINYWQRPSNIIYPTRRYGCAPDYWSWVQRST